VFWDLAKGAERCRKSGYTGFNRRINAIASNPDGSRVVVASWDATAKWYKSSDGSELAEYVDPDGVPINAVAVYPEGGLVLLGGWTGRVTCWDPAGTFATFTVQAHADSVRSVSTSREGRLLTASINGEVKLWTPMGKARAVADVDVEVSAVPETFSNIGTYDAGSHSIEAALFCSGGRHVILAAGDVLKLLDSKIGVPVGVNFGLRDGAGPVTAVSEARGGFVAVGYRSGVVRICSTETNAVVCHAVGHREAEVSVVALSPKRHDLAVGTVADSTVWLYTKAPPGADSSAWALACRLDGHRGGSIQSLAFNTATSGIRSDTAVLASGSSDGSICLWAQPSKAELAAKEVSPALTLDGHENSVTALVFLKGAAVHAAQAADHPSGGGNGSGRSRGGSFADHLVSSGRDGSVCLWNTHTAELIESSANVHTDWINDLALSPDKKLVATVSNDCTVVVRSSVGSTRETVLGTHDAAVTSVVFLSNTLVASTGLDDKIRVWCLDLDLELTTIDCVGAVAVIASPTGGCFSVGVDGLHEYSLQFGACLATLDGHRGAISGIAVGPGDRIASCGQLDRTVCGWRSSWAELPDMRHPCAVSAVAVRNVGSEMLFCSGDVNGTLCTWRSNTDSQGTFTLSTRVDNAHKGSVSALAIGDDGTIYSAGVDGRVCRWSRNLLLGGQSVCHDVPLTDLALSSLGMVIVGGWDGVLRIMTPGLDSTEQRVDPTDWMAARAVLDHSAWIGSIETWEREDRTEFLVVNALNGTVHTMQRSVGDSIFVSCATTAVNLDEPAFGNGVSASFRPKMVCASGWKGDGRGAVILSADTHGACRVHDAGLGVTAGFTAHRESVTALAPLSPCGFATASSDGRVKIWEVTDKGVSPPQTRQRGEFTCRSSVTALATAEHSANTLFCGDQLGYVYLLHPLRDGKLSTQ
jgi:WD40 repeat protein